ncbi:hypothetical protein IPZ58_27945 [Streptomyces roseoverticillatus]|uniref:hypothetical protein n=1 Tax=Streptomyces roseoverticillatus TaxID=66429 RepID=UPI001F43522B|nr:hypothetical protein [Streptomyces roseoverticillatus]MCF3105393.1 hypothetical protein [Streptomyces roseoverticillatus]
MSSLLRVQGRIGQRPLLLTTAAVPLTGWAVHAVALHKQLAATKRSPLTGLQRAADGALYDGKHSGRAVLAIAAHATVPAIVRRRAGRPGTATRGRAA